MWFLISFIAVCHIFWLVAMFFQRIKDETWRTVLQFKYKMIIISIEENNNSAVVSCRNQFNYHKELVVIDAEVIAVAG